MDRGKVMTSGPIDLVLDDPQPKTNQAERALTIS